MIPPDRHTREWITAQQARLGMADPIILEKAVFALTLLDVVAEPNVLIHIVERPVNTSFLEIAEPIAVKTPRLESLLADKLTAFAPGSIGVPLTARLAMLLKTSDFSFALPIFDPALAIGLREKQLPGQFACLNRLKSFAPEVFFYWT
jgi:hypothetical protein